MGSHPKPTFMRRYRLLLFLVPILILSFTWFSTTGLFKRVSSNLGLRVPRETEKTLPFAKLQSKATEAKVFARSAKFNDQVCFLVDLSLSSGQQRFFIYDLRKDSIRSSGLVTHGRCNEDWLEGRKYGNEPGCGCSSLGKYKIGVPYNGKFGLAYKLHGLEKTNDNAFERFVVLHSHECVPDSEIDSEICQSDGCPTVSPNFLLELKKYLSATEKPILLWVFE